MSAYSHISAMVRVLAHWQTISLMLACADGLQCNTSRSVYGRLQPYMLLLPRRGEIRHCKSPSEHGVCSGKELSQDIHVTLLAASALQVTATLLPSI